MAGGDQIDREELLQWMESTSQFAYGRTFDNKPKQLRVNRRGDFFVFVNCVLKKHTRLLNSAVDYYNRL